jgi:hypothetical protein
MIHGLMDIEHEASTEKTLPRLSVYPTSPLTLDIIVLEELGDGMGSKSIE